MNNRPLRTIPENNFIQIAKALHIRHIRRSEDPLSRICKIRHLAQFGQNRRNRGKTADLFRPMNKIHSRQFRIGIDNGGCLTILGYQKFIRDL